MKEFHSVYPEKVLTQYLKANLRDIKEIPLKEREKLKTYNPSIETFEDVAQRKLISTFKEFEYDLTLRETTDLLNVILPPLNYELNKVIFTQHVSPIPGNRADVILLTKCLEYFEKQRKTKNKIVCSIRREIYTDLFDELIRHLTIQSAERGLLLLRVKNEITMTLNSYECIANNFIKFGCHQYELTEPEKQLRENRIKELTSEVTQLKFKVLTRKKHFSAVQKSIEHHQKLLMKKFIEDIKWYNTIQKQLRLQLDDIINQFKPE